MTTVIGADSWLPPTQAVLDALKQVAGFGFMGGYVGGADLFQNTPWPKEAWDLLFANDIQPLPIYVPKQDCSEDPSFVARDAVARCMANGLHGVVAIDSEQSMSNILNYQSWLDRVSMGIFQQGWKMVTYAGSHYVAIGSFAWNVAWGQHEEVPTHAEALQYGPYTIQVNGSNVRLDSNAADESFPFAAYASPIIPEPIRRQLVNISIGVNPKTGNLIVVGRASDDGHLLVFELAHSTNPADPGAWIVADVTDNIGTAQRTYAL